MQQSSELPRRLPSRGLPHALQPRGHGCPLLRADRVWRRGVLLGAVASLQTLRRQSLVFVRIFQRYYLPLRLLDDVPAGLAACAFSRRPVLRHRRR